MELVKNIFFNTDKLVENSCVKISYTGKLFQENSEEEIFYNKKYQVLFAGNHKYWSVGPWDKTRFLNRNWDYKEPNGNINRTITESKKGS